MGTTDIWITIGALTLATLLTRGSFFMLSDVRLPPRLQHALRYAPAAALAAIIAPDLVLAGAQPTLLLANPKLIAGVAATVFFVLTRRLLGTIIFGMLVFTVARTVM